MWLDGTMIYIACVLLTKDKQNWFCIIQKGKKKWVFSIHLFYKKELGKYKTEFKQIAQVKGLEDFLHIYSWDAKHVEVCKWCWGSSWLQTTIVDKFNIQRVRGMNHCWL